jgi:hypothetical protein
MTSIEKSVFGSFFEICEYESALYDTLNCPQPYITIGNKNIKVTVLKIVLFGKNERDVPIFCFELVWRGENARYE